MSRSLFIYFECGGPVEKSGVHTVWIMYENEVKQPTKGWKCSQVGERAITETTRKDKQETHIEWTKVERKYQRTKANHRATGQEGVLKYGVQPTNKVIRPCIR